MISNMVLLKGTFAHVKDFLQNSDNKYRNWLLIIGILLASVINIYLFFSFINNFEMISTALQATNSTLFTSAIFNSCCLILGCVSSFAMRNYWMKVLQRNYQQYLNHILEAYFKQNKFLNILRNGKVKNVAQVIEAEFDNFSRLSLSLFLDFIKNSISLVIFSIQLWQLGGVFAFTLFGISVAIPGGLFWATLAFCIITNLVISKIGAKLSKETQELAVLKAEYRNELELIDQNGESIGQEKGEQFIKENLYSRFKKILKKSTLLIWIETKVEAFQELNLYISSILPYGISAPLYFLGKITLAAMFQVSTVLSQVQYSLTWFINSYRDVASLKASYTRIHRLKDEIQNNQVSALENIQKIANGNELQVKHLSIKTPAGTQIIKNLNLHFKQGKHTLIKGSSGVGKSTLLKAICGTWKYGEGIVISPEDINGQPQKPTIANVSLKANLVYPKKLSDFSQQEHLVLDKKMIEILTLIGFDKVIKQHEASTKENTSQQQIDWANVLNDETKNWGETISGGEKQMIAIARAILAQKQWLLLDEVTSAMDEETEERAFRILIDKLPNTTIISIGHRSSLDKFHDQIVTISKDAKGEAKVSMRYNLAIKRDDTQIPPRRRASSAVNLHGIWKEQEQARAVLANCAVQVYAIK